MKVTPILAAVAVALTATFAGTSEAEAANWRCGRLAGFNVCAVDRSHIDSLKLEWTNGDYTWLTVDCARRTFEAKDGAQYITYDQAKAITGAWCFG